MSDLLAEVDEAMRQERMEKFWQENKNFIIGTIVFVILATAAVSFYRSWDRAQKIEDTAKVMTLIDSPDFPDNISAEALDIRGGAKGIALLSAAGAYLSSGKEDQALRLYEQTANDHAVPADLRQPAILMTVRLQAGQGKDEKLIDNLRPVWSDMNSPWRYHAHLEAAVLLANLEKYDDAIGHLQIIGKAQALPETMYEKASGLRHLYILQQKQKNQETAAEQGS